MLKRKTFTHIILFLCILCSVVLIFSSCIFVFIEVGSPASLENADEVIANTDVNTNTSTSTDTGNDSTSTDSGNGSTNTDTDEGNGSTNTDTNTNFTASYLSTLDPAEVYLVSEVIIERERGYQINGVKGIYLKYLNGELELPSEIGGLPVWEIGQDAFRGTKLTGVTIPEGIRVIRKRAFEECNDLVRLELPKSLTYIGAQAFNSCRKLKKLTIPQNVVDIEAGAFKNNYQLSEILIRAKALNHFSDGDRIFENAGSMSEGICVKIANTVTYIPSRMFNSYVNEIIFEGGSICYLIGESAFAGSKNITVLNLPQSVQHINKNAFRGISIEKLQLSDVRTIGEGAFCNCNQLTNLQLGNSVTSIGKGAFSFCEALETVTIGENVKTIGNEAFAHASIKYITINAKELDNLKENNNIFYSATVDDAWLTFGTSVKKIPQYLFSVNNTMYRPSFERVSFVYGSSCYKIDAFAFYGAIIENFEIPSSIIQIEATAFCGQSVGNLTIDSENTRYKMVNNALFSYDTKTLVKYFDRNNISEYEIPEGTELVGSYAFYNSNITSITLPSTLTSINSYAFATSSIKGVELPASLKQSGWSAFYQCKDLEWVRIAEGIEIIQAGCFSECTKLASVTLPGTLKSIGSEAFYNCASLDSIVVPENVVELGAYAFYNIGSSASIEEISIEFKNPVGWIAVRFVDGDALKIQNVNLESWADPIKIATDLSGSYSSYHWLKANEDAIEPIDE